MAPKQFLELSVCQEGPPAFSWPRAWLEDTAQREKDVEMEMYILSGGKRVQITTTPLQKYSVTSKRNVLKK